MSVRVRPLERDALDAIEPIQRRNERLRLTVCE
jgi:hypothetical protein